MGGSSARSALLTRHLVRAGAFRSAPFVLADVGARGGFGAEWSVFGDQIKYIGFEPDPDECERINQAMADPNRRVYPTALHKHTGSFPFHITKFPNASGFYPIDMTLVGRFPVSEPLSLARAIDLPAQDLDSFARQHGIDHIDFLKLDTEGNELDILDGAARIVDRTVLGVRSEALFTPWHRGQRVFADLDTFMRAHGFTLYDLPVLRFARSALPSMANALNPATAIAGYGQVIVSDALYLRDPVRDIQNGRGDWWSESALLKMACLFELFRLPDCAVELLRFAHAEGRLSKSFGDVEALCDLVVRGFTRQTYAGYLKRLHAVRRLEVLAYYWRLLVQQRHPLSWYFEKVRGRLARRRRA